MGVSFNIMCPNSSIYSDEKSRVLVDKTKSGKVRPWREKKIANVDYFELLHILEFKKAERVKDCAEILEYKQNRETGERKLYRVWFCKSRLCPMCNWRRAMKHGIQSQKVVAEVIKQKPTVRWLFLTLTVKNVYDGEELNKSLSDMAQRFRRMMQYKKINKNYKWILCPVCGNKTRLKIREDTELKKFPLYCPKCRQENLIEIKQFKVTVITEPDAKTQSR